MLLSGVTEAIRQSFSRRRSSVDKQSSNPSAPRHRAVFPNGDRYDGGWKDGKPHGSGRYTWADSSFYDGHWREGEKHGEGQYFWADGTSYVGDWLSGRMNGTGVYTTPEGSRYEGSMLEDRRHGLGRMEYANGDVYEGLWKEGRPHGPGRYRWATGNEYDGEWVDGRMHGRGTFLWDTSERYDGEWVEGKENGFGLFTWSNGATFQGTWVQGKKHGVGIYTPGDGAAAVAAIAALADDRHPLPALQDGGPTGPQGTSEDFGASRSGREHSVQSNGSVVPAGDRPMPFGRRLTLDRGRAESGFEATTPKGPVPPAPRQHGRDKEGPSNPSDWLIVREYDRDVLVREERVPHRALRKIHGVNTKERKKAARNEGQVTRAGETIYKGHRSYDLMTSLQQGIRWSVGRGGMARGGNIILEDAHFKDKDKQFFPRAGSPKTPPHPAGDFTWKDYAPEVFRKLRKAFGVDSGDFMLSICGDRALRELSSPGKSGSVFYITHDDQYILKTVQKNECKILMEILPRYYQHMQRFPDSLLTRFYGLYRIDTGVGAGKRVRFVVMGNIFRTDLAVHTRYDLKGSTVGRVTPPEKQGPGVTLKDLDLDVSFKMERQWRDKLLFQLRMDTELLESSGIMDYSLLIGVHYRNRDFERDKDKGRAALAKGRSTEVPAAFAEEDTEDEECASPNMPQFGAAGGDRARRVTDDSSGHVAQGMREAPSLKFDNSRFSAPEQPVSAAMIGASAKGDGAGGGNGPFPWIAKRPQSLYIRSASINEPNPPLITPQTPGSTALGPEAASLLQKLMEEGWYREKTRGQSRLAHPEQTAQRGALQTPVSGKGMLTRTTTFRPQGSASTDYLNMELGYNKVQLGSNMAATAVKMRPVSLLGYKPGTAPLSEGGPTPAADVSTFPEKQQSHQQQAEAQDAEDVVLYLGVIDILQHYRLFKRLEHGLKTLRFDSRGVSVTHPEKYAARFTAFMESVFI